MATAGVASGTLTKPLRTSDVLDVVDWLSNHRPMRFFDGTSSYHCMEPGAAVMKNMSLGVEGAMKGEDLLMNATVSRRNTEDNQS